MSYTLDEIMGAAGGVKKEEGKKGVEVTLEDLGVVAPPKAGSYNPLAEAFNREGRSAPPVGGQGIIEANLAAAAQSGGRFVNNVVAGIPGVSKLATPDDGDDSHVVDQNRNTTVGRVVGAAIPSIAAAVVGGPMVGAGVGAVSGVGSAVLEGEDQGWIGGQTAAIASERAVFNAVLGMIPGLRGGGGAVKEFGKGALETAGTNILQSGFEAKLKQTLGISDEGVWKAMKDQALSGDNAVQSLIFGGVRGLIAKGEKPFGEKGEVKPETPPRPDSPTTFRRMETSFEPYRVEVETENIPAYMKQVREKFPQAGLIRMRDGGWWVVDDAPKSSQMQQTPQRPIPMNPLPTPGQGVKAPGLAPDAPVVKADNSIPLVPKEEVVVPKVVEQKPVEQVRPPSVETPAPVVENPPLERGVQNPNLPKYVEDQMVAEGKNPVRLLNEIDSARPKTVEQLANDPLTKKLESVGEVALAEKLKKGEMGMEEYQQLMAKDFSRQETFPDPLVSKSSEPTPERAFLSKFEQLEKDSQGLDAKTPEGHKRLNEIATTAAKTQMEVVDHMNATYGDKATEKTAELMAEMRRVNAKIRKAGRNAGFVDFSPVIEGALKAGKWTKAHVGVAVDWVRQKLGDGLLKLDDIRRALVTTFGGRVKPKVAEITEAVTRLTPSKEKKSLPLSGKLPWVSLVDKLEKISPGEDSFTQEIAYRARTVGDLGKQGLGTASKTFDEGYKQASRINAWSTDANDVQMVPGTKAFVGNGRVLLEPTTHTDFKISDTARSGQKAYADVNLVIGQHAEKMGGGFKATGKAQRLATYELVDAVKRFGGEVFDGYVDGLLKLNPKLTRDEVVSHYKEVREHLMNNRYDVAYRMISQEFSRGIERVPSGMYIKRGGVKTPVWFYHDKPADYLKTARERVLSRTAFKTVFGDEKLTDIRKKIMEETNGGAEIFDDLVKVFHGLPLEQGLDPAGWTSKINRGWQQFQNLAQAASTIPSTVLNLTEVVTGNNVMLHGPKATLEGINYLRKHGRQGLEDMGHIDRVLNDYSIDPNAPGWTANRVVRNVLSLPNTLANELGELTAAATRQVIADKAIAKTLSKREQAKFEYLVKLSGMSPEVAKQMAMGDAPAAQYEAFVRKSASDLTGGNIRGTERSSLENRRWFQQFFPFMSYPAMQLRLMNKTFGEVSKSLTEARKTGDYNTPQVRAAVSGFTRVWGGVAVRGAATSLVTALLSGGVDGLKIAVNEGEEQAKNEPLKFALGLFVKGIGGPLTMIHKFATSESPFDVSGYSYRMGLAQDVYFAARGSGPYKDQTLLERAATFGSRRFPASRIAMTWLGIMGVGEKNNQLDQSVTALNRWKRDNGIKTSFSSGGSEDTIAFRSTMKEASEMLRTGKDPTDYIREKLKGFDTDLNIASSLRARRVLANLPNDVTKEQLDSLKRRLGQENYDILLKFDDVLSAWADQYQNVEFVSRKVGGKKAAPLLKSPSENLIKVRTKMNTIKHEQKEKHDEIQNRSR